MYLLNKKKALAFVLAFAMVLGLAACGSGSAAAPKKTIKKAETVREITTDWAEGKAVSKADSGYSIVENNIRTVSLEASGEIDSYNCLAISGLKDKTVEDKINAEIKAVYDELNIWDIDHLPPSYGIAVIKDNYDFDHPNYTSAYCTSGYNNADIFSVRITAYASFFPKDDSDDYNNYIYMTKSESMNYDLNTGKKIKLSDTVIDGLGLDYFNNKIKEALKKSEALEEESYSWGYDDIWFKQVGEFTGLTEDQQFWINDYDGSIELIFDYRQPWVRSSSNDSVQFFTVDIAGVSALGQRFNNGTSIFEDETEVKKLIDNDDFDPYDRVEEYQGSGAETIKGTPINIYHEYSYYKSMPEEQIAYLKGDQAVTDEYIKNITSVYNNYTQGYKKQISGSVDISGYASKISKYTMVSNNIYASLYDNRDWQNLYSRESINYYIFEGDSTTPLAFEDLFKEGVDVRTAIIDAQAALFNTAGYYNEPDVVAKREAVSEETLRSFLSALYDAGFSASLSTNSFYLRYDEDDVRVLISEYMPEFESNIWAVTSGITTIPYRNIGCDKLAIF